MRNLLLIIGGFLVGAGAVAAVAVAVPNGSRVTVVQTQPTVASGVGMMGGQYGSGMMSRSGTGMMGNVVPAARTLTIVHVLRGCHVWSNGTTTGPTMRLHLMRGQTLAVFNMDVDAHQMLQFAGPMRLHLGGPMTMTHRRMTMTFSKAGIYRLGTKTVDGVGMGSMMDVKTIGPDNKLRLVVTVG